jgi:glutaryl-CoA transferase
MLLSAIRVIDLSRVLAGPVCTMMLGDLGARVIKVERPAGGDDARGWGPPFDERGLSAYFSSVNRNKLSIRADLLNRPDRDLVTQLIRSADAVIDNFLPGSLERFGLVPDALLAGCPKLVWCTISGFGPESHRPGYDFVVQAECGWMAVTGPPAGEPTKVGVALADVLAGKDAAISILAALASRSAAPADRRLFVSLAHSATSALVNVAQNVLLTGREAARYGNAHANLVPYQAFSASDRQLILAVGSDSQWRNCARALELPALASDMGLATNAGRVARRDEVVAILGDRLLTRTAAEWIERLEAVGVPCGIVRSVREALEGVAATATSGIAPLPPGRVRRPPPLLGEHDEVVRARGWDAFD